MDIIIFDGDSYNVLRKRLRMIRERLGTIARKGPAAEKWLDNQDVCLLLGISKRTLQALRDKGLLGFSQIRRKCYYKESDVKDWIEKKKNNPGGESPASVKQDGI